MGNPYKSSIWDILEAMERYGGGFVKQLAILYRHADGVNQTRLENAFQSYFTKYDEIAQKHYNDIG